PARDLLLGGGRIHAVGPRLREAERARGTDAAAGAGDDRDLVGETEPVEQHRGSLSKDEGGALHARDHGRVAAFDVARGLDGLEPVEQLFEELASLDAGERRADAEGGAEAEGNGGVGVALDGATV